VSPDKGSKNRCTYEYKLNKNEIALFNSKNVKGSNPLNVESTIKDKLESELGGADSIDQIRIGASMYRYTEMYNSNVLFLSKKQEVEELTDKFVKEKGESMIGLLAIPLIGITKEKVIETFWSSKFPALLGINNFSKNNDDTNNDNNNNNNNNEKKNVITRTNNKKGDTIYTNNATNSTLIIDVRHSLTYFIYNKGGFFPNIYETGKFNDNALSSPGFILANIEDKSDPINNADVKKYRIDLPGGKRTLGETMKECALREAGEETGIDFTQYKNNLREYIGGRGEDKMAYYIYDGVSIDQRMYAHNNNNNNKKNVMKTNGKKNGQAKKKYEPRNNNNKNRKKKANVKKLTSKLSDMTIDKNKKK